MKRRTPRHRSYSISADDSSRDVRIFISSLVIGICLGAFGVYFWAERPQARQIALLQAELSTQNSRATTCSNGRSTSIGQHAELESRLSTCVADLKRAQQALNNTPPLPRPIPERDDQAAAAPIPPDWPPLPKTPPARTSVTETPAAEPVAAPIEPAVPVPTESLPWPKEYPPQPHTKPTPPPEKNPEKTEASAAPETPPAEPVAPTPTAQPQGKLAATDSITLNVGDEHSIDSTHQLRLVAISRRNNVRYCVVAGNGLNSVRIASGSAARASWNGQNVSLTAAAQDGDTCRIGVRPL